MVHFIQSLTKCDLPDVASVNCSKQMRHAEVSHS